MKIIFKTLTMNNFMSFQNASIDYSINGYILVSGVNNNLADNAKSNGAGKSSLWEAISWCLTGNTIRGSKDVQNMYTTDAASVDLLMSIDGEDYRIIRTKDSSKSSLKVFVSGIDISGKGIRDTEKILQERLPELTSELLGSVIILGQGLPFRLSNNTPSGRKEILEHLTKTDFMIQSLKDKISYRKNEISKKAQELNNELIEWTTRLNIAETELRNATETLNSFTSIEDKQNELIQLQLQQESFVAALSSLVAPDTASLDTASNELAKKELEIKNNITQVQKENSEFTRSRNKELSDLKGQKLSLERYLNQINSMTDTCPTCGQKLPDFSRPDTSSEENERSIILEKIKNLEIELLEHEQNTSKIIESYNKELDCTRNSLREITFKLQIEKDTYYKEYARLTKAIAEIDGTINSLTSFIESYVTDKARIETLVKTKNDEIERIKNETLYNINEKIEDIKKHESAINKLNTIVTREFRGVLLNNVISYINNKAKEYSLSLFGTEYIDFSLDGNNVSIRYDNKEYENLSGGEKQKVDIIVQFAIRDMLCSLYEFSCNIIVLDEICDNVDSVGAEKLFNMISTKLHDVESIYIVSHHSDFQIPLDNEIIVVKGDDKISRIK